LSRAVISYYIKTTGSNGYNQSRLYATVYTKLANGSIREIAELFQSDRESYSLKIKEDGRNLKFSKRVDGEVRPFSMIVIDQSSEGSEQTGDPVLKIRDRLFFHRGKMYIISNVPEGKHAGHYQSGPKFISRLDNFPFSDPSSVDPLTLSRAERRLRGVRAGEIHGTGLSESGHRVSIEDGNLADIALPVSVASFLMNTTAHRHRGSSATERPVPNVS
jgi:hypothetical protein